ncbi:hypothetical protein CYY_007875 [Polysphondylium violaceum]|uniref:Carbohydrate binding domain-containing protein n=1 Tax=Polysphondylium violaceum TaxID=133409 RepID=A0A8J4PPM5_9MYCE|nr:hypothetical protein CYY_007875 [Polysphondylium violaceum]
MYRYTVLVALALVAAAYSLGTPQCTLSNKCTQVHQWMNDGVMNTQFACEITNMGSKPVTNADIRLNDNQNLYNTWEIATSNNGLSWDFVKWREQKPLAVGLSHSWGYIVKSDKPLNVEVCEKGFVNPPASPSPVHSAADASRHHPNHHNQDSSDHKDKVLKCESTLVQTIVNHYMGKDHLKYTQVDVTVHNTGEKSLTSVIFFSDVHFNSTWGMTEVDRINAPGNYEVIRKSSSLAVGSQQKFGYVFVSDNTAAPINLISNAC